MKYESYLVAINEKGLIAYKLARGYKLEEDSRLAYCKFVDPVFRYNYMIIDIDSGLFIIRGTSKAKVLEAWRDKSLNPDFVEAIIKARQTDSYFKRVIDANAEKKLWRNCGYVIEGEGYEL